MTTINTNYNPSVSGVNAINDGAVGGAAGSIDSVLLPEPKGADVGTATAQMVIEQSFSRRKMARTDRDQSTSAMIAAQNEQIAHLKEQAGRNYEAAKLEAWGKIGSGVAGIAAGGIGLLGEKGKGEYGAKAMEGAGGVWSGGAGLLSAGMKEDADNEGVVAKACENEATAQKRALENADDEIKEAREHARTALDFLREFESTRSKSMSSAIKA
jgi:hypothetical protein